MGKGEEVEKKPKKKKGRPSLLDLQKRSIKQQQQQQIQIQKSNPNSVITSGRRSTRRNPQSDDEDDENDQSRRNNRSGKIYRNSDSEDVGDEDEEEGSVLMKKKRKINAIADGSFKYKSSSSEISKVEKLVSGGTNLNTNQGVTIGTAGNKTPLPDKKLLLFILDRLEKKDTHGVFSEPVDPEELPDYHEVIKHPMDFSTIRKKLDEGAYGNLEAFESDVFLICSNAMQYNAPETVYFRQARSIQEIAEKSFDNLRQDSDADEDEPEPKRRGRPPTKHLKKPVGRPPLDRAGSDNASGATLATGKESAMWSSYDLRKSSVSHTEKAGPRDSAGPSHLNLGSSEDHNSGWSSHQKPDRNYDFTGSFLRGASYKQGKKSVASSESRRDTYNQFHPSTAVSNSVFSTFDVEKKLLLPVGLHAEYGYARSLASFAAGLGPIVWDIASKKIEKSLPPGVKFGPGWVGQDDANTQRPLLINPSSSDHAGVSDPFTPPSASAKSAFKIPGDKSTYQQEGDSSLGYQLASTIAALDFHPAAAAAISIPSLPTRPLESAAQASEVNRRSSESQAHLPQSSNIGSGTTQRPSSQFQPQGPSPTMRMGMNVNQLSNPEPQLNQLNMQLKINPLGAHQLQIPTGFRQSPIYSQMANFISRTSTNGAHPIQFPSPASDGTNLFLTNRGSVNTNSSCFSTPDSASRLPRFHPEPTSASAPTPDLNLQFQSPASPGSSRIDSNSKQPDLALQL